MEAWPKNEEGSKKRERSRKTREVKREVKREKPSTAIKTPSMPEKAKQEKSGAAKFLAATGCVFRVVGYFFTATIFCVFLYGAFEALTLLWTNGTVTTHDVAGVLNGRRFQREAGREFNAITITTRHFEGSQAEFDNQAVNDVSDPDTIYVTIDVSHRHLAIVGGSKVSLGNSVYNDAVAAFRKNIHGNDYTSATLAVLHTLHDETIFGDIFVLVFSGILFALCMGVYFVLRRLGLLPKASGGGSGSSSSSDSSWSSSSSSSSSDSGGGGGGFASGNF